MSFDVQALEAKLVTEWQILKSSDTVKGIVAMEGLALSTFVEQLLDGKVALTLEGLKGWLLIQAALVLAFLFRKAWAGIEVQLARVGVQQAQADAIEAKVQARAIAIVGEKHPLAAADLKEAFAAPPGAP